MHLIFFFLIREYFYLYFSFKSEKKILSKKQDKKKSKIINRESEWKMRHIIYIITTTTSKECWQISLPTVYIWITHIIHYYNNTTDNILQLSLHSIVICSRTIQKIFKIQHCLINLTSYLWMVYTQSNICMLLLTIHSVICLASGQAMIKWAVNNFSLIFTFLSGFYPTLNMVFYLFVCLHFKKPLFVSFYPW